MLCEAVWLLYMQVPSGENLRGLPGRMTVLAWVDPEQVRLVCIMMLFMVLLIDKRFLHDATTVAIRKL